MWWMLLLFMLAHAEDGGSTGGAGVVATASDYTLGAGDLLYLEVFGEPEMSRELRIAEDGTVSVPYVGALQMSGLTVDRAEAQIVAALGNSVLVSPQVVLHVRSYGRSVDVSGRVRTVGQYPITRPGMTVTQVLVAAGGTLDVSAPYARLSRGGQQYIIDLEAILAGNRETDMPVEPGDTIQVPETPTVQVMGSVVDAGLVPYRPGLRLTDALAAAKGLTQTANRRVILLTRDGKTIKVNYVRILKHLEEDPELRPYDKIEVTESAV